jgi:phosphatidylserine decarboxylase
MIIAREAWLLLLTAIGAAILAYLLCGVYCALPLILIALIIYYLFREPVCRVPPTPLGIVSPVDGKITAIEEVNDPYLGRQAVKLSIRMHAMGPYVLRSPTEGRVMQQWYLPEGLDAHLLGNVDVSAIRRNPAAQQGRFAMWVQTDEEDDVILVLGGVLISRRLRCTAQVGERIGQGQRCGLVQFTATAEVYVPASSRVEKTQGDAVQAGSAIIATLIHKGSPPAAMVQG